MQTLSVCIIAILLAAGGTRGCALHSNCEDAKRVLGINDCRSTVVVLEDVTVAVAFSMVHASWGGEFQLELSRALIFAQSIEGLSQLRN